MDALQQSKEFFDNQILAPSKPVQIRDLRAAYLAKMYWLGYFTNQLGRTPDEDLVTQRAKETWQNFLSHADAMEIAIIQTLK